MAQVALVRLDWDRTAVPLRAARDFFTLHIGPEPAHPFGRKGLALKGAWCQLGNNGPEPAAGMVILDGDVAIDPGDIAAMLAAIIAEPGVIHVAPVKLWPVSTKLPYWTWGHGLHAEGLTQTDHDNPDFFSFCFTYLPRAVIEACIKAGMDRWAFPHVDEQAQVQAGKLGIPVRVVRSAHPVHLNY